MPRLRAFVWRSKFSAGLLAALGLLITLAILDRLLPPPINAAATGLSQIVLAADGQPLRAFADENGVWRYPVHLDQIAPNYLKTVISYEDRWFYRHPGVNPLALLRASGQMLRSGRVVSGGSTLSMQVARMIEPIGRGVPGKLKQILRALQLELRLSKAEILTIYLNRAPFGGTIEGVQTASYAYLGRSAAQLTDAEAALLAVIPQSPSRLRPDRWPKRAELARNKVLKRVARAERWTAQRLTDAFAEPVVAMRLRDPLHAALLAERLQRTDDRPVIHTLIDAHLQRALEERVANYVKRYPAGTSAAVAVVDNRSMATLAYVGSAQFGDVARFGHIDMLRAWRSPGSTLKPFLYGLAIEQGLIHSASLLMDVPVDFNGYRPQNFEGGYRGPLSASEALGRSLNIPAVDLLERIHPSVFSGRLAHAGLTLRVPPGTRPNLSLILGGAGVQLERLISAFAALSRDGLMAPMRLKPEDPLRERRLLDPAAAWVVRQMLVENPRPGLNLNAVDARAERALAWKTGTSFGYRDALALGTNSAVTVGVWIGRPDGTPNPGEFGAHTALPLLFEIADSLARTRPRAPPTRPSGVEAIVACWPLGRPLAQTEPSACARKIEGYAIHGFNPPTFADRDAALGEINPATLLIDPKGRRVTSACGQGQPVLLARWPRLAGPWLSPQERVHSRLPPMAPGCPPAPSNAIKIIGLESGSTIARAPTQQKLTVQLRVDRADGLIYWLDNERLIGTTRGSAWLLHTFETRGAHRVVALTENGAFDAINVEVAL